MRLPSPLSGLPGSLSAASPSRFSAKWGIPLDHSIGRKTYVLRCRCFDRTAEHGSALDQLPARDPPCPARTIAGWSPASRWGSSARRPPGTRIPSARARVTPAVRGRSGRRRSRVGTSPSDGARSMTSHRPHAPEPPMPSKTRASSEWSPVRSVVDMSISWIPSSASCRSTSPTRQCGRRVVPDPEREAAGRVARSPSPAPPRRRARRHPVRREPEPLAGHVRTFGDEFLERELRRARGPSANVLGISPGSGLRARRGLGGRGGFG